MTFQYLESYTHAMFSAVSKEQEQILGTIAMEERSLFICQTATCAEKVWTFLAISLTLLRIKEQFQKGVELLQH